VIKKERERKRGELASVLALMVLDEMK